MTTTNRIAPPNLSALERAIWHAIAYVDVFDYPLTTTEIHRYLDRMPASLTDVETALHAGQLLPQHLTQRGPYTMFAGREHLVEIRQEREARSQALWPAAIRYGRLIGGLPFVRMVAITGSLAVNNVDVQADIDYLIVTENDRLWLCRAFIILIVRLAARHGLILCPNYILAERALHFPDQNLYTAHEVAQMIPVSGNDTYQLLRQENDWLRDILPNAADPPRNLARLQARPGRWQQLLEPPLRTPLGRWLEHWEMARKTRKLQGQRHAHHETDFTADWCKGHFVDHQRRTMVAYQTHMIHASQHSETGGG